MNCQYCGKPKSGTHCAECSVNSGFQSLKQAYRDGYAAHEADTKATISEVCRMHYMRGFNECRQRILDIILEMDRNSGSALVSIRSLKPLEREGRCIHDVHGNDCFKCFPEETESK